MCAGLGGQEGVQLGQPFNEPPALLRQWHRIAHRPPRAEMVPQLVVGRAEAGRRDEAAEAAHRVVPLLDAPMVLLQPVVQVLAAAVLDPSPAVPRMALG